MFKWFGNFVDSHEKELDRLRRLVGQVNDNIVDLLGHQLDDLAAIHGELNGLVRSAGADLQLKEALASDMREITAELKRLSAEAPETRRVIEQGDTGARGLNTLMATRKELISLDRARQKQAAGRAEIEEDLLRLRRDLQDGLRSLAAENPKLDDLVAKLPEQPSGEIKPGDEGRYYLQPDALSKMVDSAEEILGPEVRGYFERLSTINRALSRAVAYISLLGENSLGRGQAATAARGPAVFESRSNEGRDLAAPLGELQAATRNLTDVLAANDLTKHLQRQGLILPAELLAAPGDLPATVQQTTSGGSGGGFFRRNKPAPVAATPAALVATPKDDLADLLSWQEAAAEELFNAVDRALSNTRGGAPVLAQFNEVRARFQASEQRLASRMADYRGRLIAARTQLWDDTYATLTREIDAELVASFFGELEEVLSQQEAALASIAADAERHYAPPVAVKPLQMADLMNRRDKITNDGFRRLIASLRADGERSEADRVRTIETDFRKAERDQEQSLLSEILPEVFATIWESSRRNIGLRPADVQFMGGITMHEGKIAEMRTGEGKTLTASLALSLQALSARGTHLITVNEYLVRRDSDWMGPIYAMLGLTVGVILNDMQAHERFAEYRADITYGTNSEFGFDYLRDNTSASPESVVQRPHNYAMVDEVDNILIDEARTPLIISGPSQQTSKVHDLAAAFARTLRADEDYTLDEKGRSVVFTEEGIARAERHFQIDNLYHPDNFTLVYGLDNALKAWAMFRRDKDYVIVQGEEVLSAGSRPNPKEPMEVVIVDEFTGRLMPGRRYSEGLHEAIEAKEGLVVRGESLTFATITIQNYFRLYPKLAGMTGTAMTEAEEFYKIYKLEVIAIPTRLPMVRQDFVDRVYRTERGKFNAVVQEIKEETERGRPVLVGTVSIEKSEELSKMLDEAGIGHTLLNAKQHEREASIVAQAGQKGSVTISTNMAGRGTDITLGFGVSELGGLHIIGTERHESRRIDNQLRGRAGRQGDPGSSRFYVSMEDEIMRRSGMSQNVVNSRIFTAVWEEDQPIEYNMVSKSVEQAQTKMEGFNFDLRKHLVDYDDVVNTQRDVIYKERRYVLLQGDPQTIVRDMLAELVDDASSNATSLGADGRPLPRDARKLNAMSPDQFLDTMSGAFSDEVMNRLVRNLLRDDLAALIEDGNRAELGAEVQSLAQEAYNSSKESLVDRYDKELIRAFHIGDQMYENVTPDVDFNKLLATFKSRNLPQPADVVGADFQGMEYDEARQYFTEFADEWFSKEIAGRLEELLNLLESTAERGDALQRSSTLREARGGNEVPMPHPAEDENPALAEAGALVDIINAQFPLSTESAAARLAPGEDLSTLISNALEELYEEVETQMGTEFVRRLSGNPLVSLAGSHIPVSAYREIEGQIGVEKLEEIEGLTLGEIEPDIQDLFVQAFLKDQEGRWILRAVDDLWTRHLTGMESLRESIGLQAYAQRDPLIEYKRNSYELFAELKRQIRQVAVGVLSLRVVAPEQQPVRRQAAAANTPAPAIAPPANDASALVGAGAAKGGNGSNDGGSRQQAARNDRAPRGARPAAAAAPVAAVSGAVRKVGRNDPCPCGSGKKYKMCHGR